MIFMEETKMKKIDNNIDYTNILNKIFVALVIIIALLFINTVLTISNGSETKEKEIIKETTEKTETDYDTSQFNEVDVDGALALFAKKETSVLYIGRADCSACVSYIPQLQEAQANLGYTTQYLDLNKVVAENVSKESLTKFLGKLTAKTTATVSGEKTTGTYGETFWGVTPMTIIIEDGKQVDGLLGAYPYEELEKLLSKYNIGK